MPERRTLKARPISTDKIELRLMLLAAGFLVLSGLALTLTPAVRAHSWSVSYRWIHWIGLAVWVVFFSLVA
jgi:hypothetical protein